jgi:vacuolar-type H+-ATPase subunit E/Vma4
MSLANLLDAITAQANDEIAAFKQASDNRLAAAKTHHAMAISECQGAILTQVEQRKTMLRAKSETHANLQGRSAVLKARQAIIDEMFQSALEKLSALPEQKVENLLMRLLSALPSKGIVRPTVKHAGIIKRLLQNSALQIGEPINASGGFLFQNDIQERTCTFEHLVQNELRSAKELWVAKQLSSK